MVAPNLVRQAARRLEEKRRDAREPGAEAAKPSDIPLEGWRQILLRAWGSFNRDQILAVAAGVTYFALLALFPAVAAFVSLYGLVANVADTERQVAQLAGVLPAGALKIVGDQMTRLATTPHGSLGAAFAAGLLISVWSANAGIKALIAGLNIAYEERERRGFFVLNAVSLGFTVGVVILAVAAMAAVAAAPAALQLLHLEKLEALSVLRWPVLLLAVAGLCSLLYRFGPCRQQARWRWITPGGAVATLLWLIMSILFSWYVGNFGAYDKTYGSLGALVGFMTWIWLSVTVVLLGAELNAETERQTTVDTTTGDPVPPGFRGASVTDRSREGPDARG